MSLPGYIELHDAKTGKPLLIWGRSVRKLAEREPMPQHGLPEPFRSVTAVYQLGENAGYDIHLVRETYHEIKLALEAALADSTAA